MNVFLIASHSASRSASPRVSLWLKALRDGPSRLVDVEEVDVRGRPLGRGTIEKTVQIGLRLIFLPVEFLLIAGRQPFVEMAQDQQQRRQALLAIHLVRSVIVRAQHEWLKAVELFRLRILPLGELPDVVQQLGTCVGVQR